MEEPVKVELKALPDHLEYAFLLGDDQLPVVISSSLFVLEKNKFLKVKVSQESHFMSSFDPCLLNLAKMLTRCEKTNLVLNWNKCHFMVKKGIVLGHKISCVGIEIRDKKGEENLAADHFSRLENHETEGLNEGEIDDRFSDEYIMKMNFGLEEPWCGKNSQLNELEELRLQAYETSKMYKECTKKWHDNYLKAKKKFQTGDRVLLFNSRIKLFLGKLKSQWSGPFMVKQAYPYGTIKLFNSDGTSFKVIYDEEKPESS
nr:hypothetical protein [Tanacetum cinerariifolium]